MARSLLVTGGAGFIGSNFIHYWLDKHPEDTIYNLDALTYAGSLTNLQDVEELPNYVFIQGSINDRELVDKIMDDVDTVVHFAAESHVDRSILNPSIFLETNVLGTHTLLESAREHGIKHFHHISTDEVFGSLPYEGTDSFTEKTPYDPRSPYSASKAGSDHLVRAYGETFNFPYTITNCSNNYGPYHFPEKLFPLMITNIMDGKQVPVYGDGANVRDWLYVEDHCSAIEAVIEAGPTQETYLVGGDTNITNLDVVKLVIELMGASEELITFVKDRAGHDHRYTVDWSKIGNELGWKPSVDLREGLQKTIDWYQAHEDWWRPLKEKEASYFKQQYQTEK